MTYDKVYGYTNTMQEQVQYLTVAQAAAYLEITRQAIYSAMERGTLTGYKVYGHVLLDANQVHHYKPYRYPGKRTRKGTKAVQKTEQSNSGDFQEFREEWT